jgi:hypothetical protein
MRLFNGEIIVTNYVGTDETVYDLLYFQAERHY